jgi:hypothetical protein
VEVDAEDDRTHGPGRLDEGLLDEDEVVELLEGGACDVEEEVGAEARHLRPLARFAPS